MRLGLNCAFSSCPSITKRTFYSISVSWFTFPPCMCIIHNFPSYSLTMLFMPRLCSPFSLVQHTWASPNCFHVSPVPSSSLQFLSLCQIIDNPVAFQLSFLAQVADKVYIPGLFSLCLVIDRPLLLFRGLDINPCSNF